MEEAGEQRSERIPSDSPPGPDAILNQLVESPEMLSNLSQALMPAMVAHFEALARGTARGTGNGAGIREDARNDAELARLGNGENPAQGDTSHNGPADTTPFMGPMLWVGNSAPPGTAALSSQGNAAYFPVGNAALSSQGNAAYFPGGNAAPPFPTYPLLVPWNMSVGTWPVIQESQSAQPEVPLDGGTFGRRRGG